jgi:DNA polymerase III delta prime subunit
MQTNDDMFIWVEKYRPQKVADCILPNRLKSFFSEVVKGEWKDMPNMLLSGGAGCGKTSVAKALCMEMNLDYIIVNCSEDGNIDTLRVKIRNFASSVSLSGNGKVVILDEFDYANPSSMQPALRGFMEEFAKSCRFVLTCNFKNKVIEPLHSRCTCLDFRYDGKEKKELSSQFFDRTKFILENEKVKYDDKVLAKLVVKYSPDFRRLINELQRYSTSGDIDSGILAEAGDIDIEDLIGHMKTKNITNIRSWVFSNLDNDQSMIFRKLYDILSKKLSPASIATAILIIADYQYKSAFVADQEINLVACIVQLAMECEFEK